MQTRRGRIENGAVVLADPSGVPEGAEVTVLIGRPEDPVDVSDEELREIDEGLAESKAGSRIVARTFHRELRRNR